MKYRVVTRKLSEALQIINTLRANNSSQINLLRCVYMPNEEDITYIIPALDYINENIAEDSIKAFSLYQMVNEN